MIQLSQAVCTVDALRASRRKVLLPDRTQNPSIHEALAKVQLLL